MPETTQAPNQQLPTPLQQYVHKSRYARWRDKESRREHWHETVQRYVDYFDSKFPHFPKQEIYEAILNTQAMPSMRALMTAGPALDRDPMAGFNCFAGTQRFLTQDGLQSFADTCGTTQQVLNGYGQWANAEIKSFGTQALNKISFKPVGEYARSRTLLRHEVLATADHRWITINRGEVTDLKVGDKVAFVGKDGLQGNREAFIRGFLFGDGTLDTRGRARIRVCGDKAKHVMPTIQAFGHSSIMSPPSHDGDPLVVFHKGWFEDCKQLPRNQDATYLASWLQGYLAADGHNDPKQPGISTQDADAAEFVKSIAAFAGYHVTGDNVSLVTDTNYGPRSAPLRRLTLRQEGAFIVTAIEEEVDTQEVFCAVVPDTHDFVLEHGIHTGNCSFVAVDHPRAFDEILYILMCGTGVGFSVERQFIAKLPVIGAKVTVSEDGKLGIETVDQLQPIDHTIVVRDSKGGWANAYKELLNHLYAGRIPKWDVSKIRPAGAKLKVFGGRASGPQPLVDLFKFTVETFDNAVGRKLTSIECHDIVCKIADIVVVGGVRRSALISLSNLSDDRMRVAKSGQWWTTDPQRALANNSAVYNERPQAEIFMKEWLALIESKSGERGIFNRDAAIKKAISIGRRDPTQIVGTNPCAEISLRSMGVCNLSEAVIRAEDSLPDLMEKVRIATIIGTYQAMLTNFRHVRAEWKHNQEDERLLGVSLTGIMDHPILSQVSDTARAWLDQLRQCAIDTNTLWAAKLGIRQSVAITTVKPSGTVSQLVDAASGKHERYAPFYIRTVRGDNKDPLTQMMISQGFPSEPALGKEESTTVFSFAVKSPAGVCTRNDRTAIQQLEHYLMFQEHWSEHNVSNTIYVRDHEWLEVGAWVYKHFDKLAGVSFLPHSDHSYRQAPYTECTEAEYEALKARTPPIDWDYLTVFERDDSTVNTKELACTAGTCELV